MAGVKNAHNNPILCDQEAKPLPKFKHYDYKQSSVAVINVSIRVRQADVQYHVYRLLKGRVESDKGREIYGHRMSVVAPVFGNIGTNKGLSRIRQRG